MIFDYSTLQLIWWLFLGILLIGFAIMDGHDMGVATLLPFVAKTDDERRVVINAVSPHWDGNQVWFITAGGALFAAFPTVYATAFSGLYWALLAVLGALFLRPVGFDYRSKVNHSTWRNSWDWLLFIGGFVPPILFGVAFGNLLQGVPFYFDANLRSIYTGSFWTLLNPFALLCGVVSSAMITTHGAHYTMLRTEGDIYRKAKTIAILTSSITAISFLYAGLLVVDLKSFSFNADASNLNMILNQGLNNHSVVIKSGGLLSNFNNHVGLWLIPMIAVVTTFAGSALAWFNSPLKAFVMSSINISTIIFTAGIALFPLILPSSIHPDGSLTIWNATASHRTLNIMFWVTLFFLPIIIIYTSWAYKVMSGKLTTKYIRDNSHSLY